MGIFCKGWNWKYKKEKKYIYIYTLVTNPCDAWDNLMKFIYIYFSQINTCFKMNMFHLLFIIWLKAYYYFFFPFQSLLFTKLKIAMEYKSSALSFSSNLWTHKQGSTNRLWAIIRIHNTNLGKRNHIQHFLDSMRWWVT